MEQTWTSPIIDDCIYHGFGLLSSSAGPGEVLLVSVISYIILYVFLPPNKLWTRRKHRMYVSMERHWFPVGTTAGTPYPLMCLETACYLMEVAWQAYYDPETTSYASSFAPGKMDLTALRLTLTCVFKDEVTDTFGFLAKSPNRWVLAFRGSSSPKNFITDLKFTQISLEDVLPDFHSSNQLTSTDSVVSSNGGRRPNRCLKCLRNCVKQLPGARQALPRVHLGFAQAYVALRQDILQAISTALETEYCPIFVTGHSMGGALACIAAYDINTTFAGVSTNVYTFGSPRIGNGAFVREFDSKVPNCFRIVVDGDIVVGVPHSLLTFRHAGTEVLVDAEGCGSLIVNPTLVEALFGTRGYRSGSNHYLSRYRDCLESAFTDDELSEYLAKGISASCQRSRKAEELNPYLSHSVDVPDWLKSTRRTSQPESEGTGNAYLFLDPETYKKLSTPTDYDYFQEE